MKYFYTRKVIFLPKAMLRFNMIATKSPNLSVPSFRIQRCITAPKIVAFICNPTSLKASRNRSAFKIPLFSSYKINKLYKGCVVLPCSLCLRELDISIFIRVYSYLCPILKYVVPHLQATHQVFEVLKCNPSQTSAVKCNYNLATYLYTSAAFDII